MRKVKDNKISSPLKLVILIAIIVIGFTLMDTSDGAQLTNQGHTCDWNAAQLSMVYRLDGYSYRYMRNHTDSSVVDWVYAQNRETIVTAPGSLKASFYDSCE